MGWLYVLAAEGAPKLKIGFTGTKAIGNRLRSARHGDPDLEVLTKLRVSEAAALERRVHRALAAFAWQKGRRFANYRTATDWFWRTPEVESFVRILRVAARQRRHDRQQTIDSLIARAEGTARCNMCGNRIAIDADLDDVDRHRACAQHAQAEGERLRAAREDARQRRSAIAADVATAADSFGYLNLSQAAQRTGGSKAWIARCVDEGRLKAIRLPGSNEPWIHPDWIDAYVCSLATFTSTAEAKLAGSP